MRGVFEERAVNSQRLVLTISAVAIVTAAVNGLGLRLAARQGTPAIELGTSAGLNGLPGVQYALGDLKADDAPSRHS
jgi:hypothetical protein